MISRIDSGEALAHNGNMKPVSVYAYTDQLGRKPEDRATSRTPAMNARCSHLVIMWLMPSSMKPERGCFARSAADSLRVRRGGH